MIEISFTGEDLVIKNSIATGSRKIPNKLVITKSGVKYIFLTGVYMSKLSA